MVYFGGIRCISVYFGSYIDELWFISVGFGVFRCIAVFTLTGRSGQTITRQIRNHLVAPLHTCPFFNIVILVEIWHAIHV